jgi:hypothetical protein
MVIGGGFLTKFAFFYVDLRYLELHDKCNMGDLMEKVYKLKLCFSETTEPLDIKIGWDVA